MRNKILIDLERFRYPNSGIATVFRNLACGLQKFDHNLDITFFLGKKKSIEIEPSQKFILWKKWHKFYENFSSNYDIIHTSNQLSSYFHRKYNASQKIVTLHDLNFLHEDLSPPKKAKMLEKVNNNIKNADYLICISNFVKNDVLQNKAVLKLDNIKEILVIHNGIKLPEKRNYNLGQYDFLRDKKYILNIGVLFSKKNQKTLVEILPYLEEDLVLISSEQKQPYADEVKKVIIDLGLSDRVHILSQVSDEEKYAIIQNCEAMCHPSLAEGFGIPPIEAMAFGKPVFLSRSTSLPEIGGDVAFYFENFEPDNMLQIIKQGLSQYNSDPKMRENLISWTAQFDYRVMSKNYLDLYQRILNS